jgi:glycosyltransferase involved in cell wall biosynthesis
LNAPATIVVTGPARGLVGGQSRHVDLLEQIAGHLGCRFIRVEIGRRVAERGRARLLLRMGRDYLGFVRAISDSRKAGGPVVVHINSSVQLASLCRDLGFAAIARAIGPEVHLVQVHGCELASASDRKPLLRGLARLLVLACRRFVVLSSVQAQAIGGPALRSLVIPNAIPLGEAVVRPRLPGKPLQILYLARMIPEKGVLVCLDAIKLLREKGVNARLTLAGDGPLLPELAIRVRQLDVGQSVTILGAVAPAEVRPLLASHDLLWAPSCYAEGQPYSLLEAMEAGLPVLATISTPAMQEMVTPAHGALIPTAPDPAALAAATERLVLLPGELESLQQRARIAAEVAFSMDACLPLWRKAWSPDGTQPEFERAPSA